MDVTFLTPAYQAEATLAATLAGILAQETERSFEVIVVNDGSTDRTAEIARGFGDRVRVIDKPNGGEASALNAGWQEARGALVAIVEGDVELRPDWLERCASALDGDDVWAAGGALETPSEDPWIARLAGYEIERKFQSKPRDAKHLTSANVLYRREAFDLAGPFDERLLNASLDSVFNGKLTAAGKRLVYEDAARVRHHYKPTLLAYLRRQYAYGRYRAQNTVLDLYPADRFLAAHVALAAVAAALTALAPIAVYAPTRAPSAALLAGPALFALALLLQVPRALGILTARKDAAGLLHPPVIVLRNVVAAVGYAIGLSMRSVGRV